MNIERIFELVEEYGRVVLVREDGRECLVSSLPEERGFEEEIYDLNALMEEDGGIVENFDDIGDFGDNAPEFSENGDIDAGFVENVEDLTKEQLIDRINRDIALWRENQDGSGENIGVDEIFKDESGDNEVYLEPVG